DCACDLIRHVRVIGASHDDRPKGHIVYVNRVIVYTADWHLAVIAEPRERRPYLYFGVFVFILRLRPLRREVRGDSAVRTDESDHAEIVVVVLPPDTLTHRQLLPGPQGSAWSRVGPVGGTGRCGTWRAGLGRANCAA